VIGDVIGEISREEILRRFEAWLDNALADEEPPLGIEAEMLAAITGNSQGLAGQGPASQAPNSAYSLWAAMTALTQEVKLQGRSFKELNQTLGSQESRMEDRERDILVRETERRCRKEVLGILIDLRDRLQRGLESVRASEAGMAKPGSGSHRDLKPAAAGWRARLFSRPIPNGAEETLAALKKGYELGLERLDQTLEEFNAREIPCAGQAFDPRRMNAIDRQESSTVPAGRVVEVYRSGYEWNGEVFRPAQVKVSCAPEGEKNE
jgi:molecular chaperone GrpE